MQKFKKSLMAAGATGVIGIAALAGTSFAAAQTSSSDGTTTSDPTSSLVQKLADTFHLNKSDVQKVFDEDRAAHEAEMDQKVEDALSNAVTDGKLTEAQKSAILAKRDELKATRDSSKHNFANMTEEERRSAMETKRTELQTWADENNIPKEYLRYVFGGHKFVQFGPPPAADSSTTN